MHISNTGKRNILIFVLCVSVLLGGCGQANIEERARESANKSQAYFDRSVAQYRQIIAAGKGSAAVHEKLAVLLFSRGDYDAALAELKHNESPQALKLRAFANYKLGNYTDALEIFNKLELPDEEYQYYKGLTCEKLNLFDSALTSYAGISRGEFLARARERIQGINRGAGAHIKDTDAGLYELIAKSPSQDAYPQAGALILACDEQVNVKSDGTAVSDHHYVVKILNERGKEDFSETQIAYDSTYEKIELRYARIIKPDGTVVDVGSRHIRDVSKYLNFPLYSNVRVFIISFPEVADGAVIDYAFRMYDNQLINKKHFITGYPVQGPEPILEARFKIIIPKELPLHIELRNAVYNTFGAQLEPSVLEEDGTLIYTWAFNDIPQMIAESLMPPDSETNPVILCSTFTDWHEVYTWWRGLADDKIRTDAAIKDKLKELLQGKDTDEDKVRAIYHFCAKDIRYVAVEYGQAGYEPHPATDIFKNKYGDCKDQAILLVAMLREAGLEAWPVLIATKQAYNASEGFPSAMFNHCIASVHLAGKIIFLDPTAETCSFGDLPGGDQDRTVLIVGDERYTLGKTPLYQATHNVSRQHTSIVINPDETIRAQKVITTSGVYGQGQRYWLLYTQPELIKETLNERVQDICIGGSLIDYRIENLQDLNQLVTLRYSFQGPEFLTPAGQLRILPQLTGLDTSSVAKERHTYPLDFGILNAQDTVVEIALPPGYRVKYLPANVSEDSPWLSVRVAYAQNAGAITFSDRSESKKIAVSTAEYPAYKAFIEQVAKKLKQRIVLEKVR